LLYRRSKNASKCEGTIHRSRFSGEQTNFSLGPARSGNNYNPENAVQIINDQYNGFSTAKSIKNGVSQRRRSQRHTPGPILGPENWLGVTKRRRIDSIYEQAWGRGEGLDLQGAVRYIYGMRNGLQMKISSGPRRGSKKRSNKKTRDSPDLQNAGRGLLAPHRRA